MVNLENFQFIDNFGHSSLKQDVMIRYDTKYSFIEKVHIKNTVF